MFNYCKIVAEIGCIHLGSIERAKKLIKLAKLCEADYVKLQKRNPDESTPDHIKNKPHPNEMFSYGKTYLEHRKNLELNIEEHKELNEYCKKIGIGYSSSVWDITSAREIISLHPDFIKVPSACNLHWEMLEVLFKEYNGNIHISTGMTSSNELKLIIDFVKKHDSYGDRLVLYHCTSAYPCPFEHLYLREIESLDGSLYSNDLSNATIGFSNHGYGISADIAAYCMGAKWIERHFVDDRTIKHTDAAASLEPIGLSKLCRDLKAIRCAMQFRPEKMDELESEQRKKLKYIT